MAVNALTATGKTVGSPGIGKPILNPIPFTPGVAVNPGGGPVYDYARTKWELDSLSQLYKNDVPFTSSTITATISYLVTDWRGLIYAIDVNGTAYYCYPTFTDFVNTPSFLTPYNGPFAPTPYGYILPYNIHNQSLISPADGHQWWIDSGFDIINDGVTVITGAYWIEVAPTPVGVTPATDIWITTDISTHWWYWANGTMNAAGALRPILPFAAAPGLTVASPALGAPVLSTAKVVVLTKANNGAPWIVPADFGSLVSIECLAGGGSGSMGATNGTGIGGGGGGAYSKSTGLVMAVGNSFQFNVGAGGARIVGTGLNSTIAANPGGDTWFNATSLANAVANGAALSVGAQGGRGGATSTGGAAASGVGATKFSGGNGVIGGGTGWNGGGAAGPAGAGGAATTTAGGTANNGAVAGATSTHTAGYSGTEWFGPGCGSGGFGQAIGAGDAGQYGGGGGGTTNNTSGKQGSLGGDGLIVITYNVISPVANITAPPLAVGSPDATAAAFNQSQGIIAPALAVSALALGAPMLSLNLSSVGINVGSPSFTMPMAEASLFGSTLILGSPQFGFPFMVQRQAIPPVGLTVGSPALPVLSTTSIAVLTPVGITTAAIGLPAAFLHGLLDPVFLVPGSPAIGAPRIGQQQGLTAAFAVGSPDIPARTFYQVHGLAALGFDTGSPVYSLASTLPQLPLFASEFDIGSPAIDAPSMNVGRSLGSPGITVGSPSLVAAPFGQTQVFTPPSFASGSPVIDPVGAAVPLNGIAPSLNGQWLSTRGSPYALVSDVFHSYTLAADGTIYRDGVLTQASVIADGIEKATSTTMLGDLSITQMAWAWGSFGWAYYMAGVWVYSPPPNLQFPSTILTVGSPAIGIPASKQIHNIPAVGITVDGPHVGSTTFHAESAPGTYLIWQSLGKVYDQNNNVWTFGIVNPQNASEAQVLRNGVDPYATQLYASTIQIGPPQFTYTDGGAVGQAPVTGWVRTAHGQWYFDNGGTRMVPWPAAPNFTMVPAGITIARPTIGTGPDMTLHDALGFTVGSPDIGTAAGLTTAPLIRTYVTLPPPIGIELGPGNIVVAWPEAGEINHLVAENLNVWVPDIGDQPLAVALAGNIIGTTDKINPYIDIHSPSDLLYRASSGLEKAMADTDGLRLMATYAELISDQWDPYAISSNNLPFLAFAMGVNLWEADWSDSFRRYWVANQWEMQSQRGSLLGTQNFVAANAPQRVAHWIVPPAKFHPGKSMTDEERAQYNSRFAQLRLYPYVARIQLPWLCYVSNFRVGIEQKRRYTNNGCFLGPIRKMYPTSADAGGRYTRTATIWDRGVETPITVRTISEVAIGGTVTTWDEVIVPAKIANHYYAGQENKWPLPKGHPIRQNKYGIFLGIMDDTASRIIKIPRNGELDAATAKAIYQTIVPDNTYIDVYPQHVATPHPISARRLYGRVRNGKPKQFLFNKFLPTNGAFQFLYEVWYIFDYSRVPDYRRASVYMGQARFGIHKYTAELRIEIPIKWRKWYLYNGGFMRGHLHPPDTREIDKCRRAVTASMAVRDTIRIDTIVKRRINTNDSLPCDGTFTVGQYIDA
jgi:phage tail P2-like protein